MNILAVVALILGIVGAALALLLPEPHRNLAVVCVGVGLAFLAAAEVFG